MSNTRWAVMLALLAIGGCQSPAGSAVDASSRPTGYVAAETPSFGPPPTTPVESNATVSTTFPVVLTAGTSAEDVNSGSELITSEPNHELIQPLRLNLFQALETALLQNPDLVVLRRNEGVGRGALGVAQTYPFNPFVQVQATPFQDAKNAGPGTTYHYVLLMQTLQLGHQQQYREESAMAALNSVRWNILQAELANVAQTERLFFTALYQRGLRDLAEANANLNRQLLTVLEKQLEAGQASAADAAIVRLDSRTTQQQADLAEANYQTALLDLRRQLNIALEVSFELEGDLADWQWRSPNEEQFLAAVCPNHTRLVPTDGETLLSELVARRPDLMAARFDVAVARANANLARGSRRPDLQIGPYYQRTESGTTYLGFRAQSDIPVVNNGVPLVRQREAEVSQRTAVWQQLQLRAQLEARIAMDRYERARRLATRSAAGTEESLPTELRRLEEQFKAGEVDILRVVTARTSLIQFRRAHLDSLNELAQSAAMVTQATGLTPEVLTSPASQQTQPAPPTLLEQRQK